MGKALKNIPKPDEEKLALFYGQKPKSQGPTHASPPGTSTLDKTTTVDKKSTVDDITTVDNVSTGDKISTVAELTTEDKMSTVVNMSTADILRIVLPHLEALTRTEKDIYIHLLQDCIQRGDTTTNWMGYRSLARAANTARRTVQRSIGTLIKENLIVKTEYANSAQIRGSRYRVSLPPGAEMSTVDNPVQP